MDRYIADKFHTFTVLGDYSEFSEHIDGKAYIFPEKNHVFVYSDDSLDQVRDSVSRVYESDKGLKFVNENNENYSVDKIYSCTLADVREETIPGQELYDERALRDMNAATSVFVPVINETDDFLKKIVKTAILEKHIDIKMLQHRMDKKYALTNMKSALIGSTKMTVLNFMMWCDLLNIDFEMMVYDTNDKQLPMGHVLHYSSETNQLNIKDR